MGLGDMTKVRVFDIEADNLFYEVTTLHCAVFSSLDGKEVDRFVEGQWEELKAFMDTCDVLIAHNCIQYDFPVLEKLIGYTYRGKKVDTMLMSRLQNPHRTVPPQALKDPDANKAPHGLAAWGYRVGIAKPHIDDWMGMSEQILVRCETDVAINVATYHALKKEGKGQNWRDAHLMTFTLWENLWKQEQAGWLLDEAYIHKSIKLLTHWIERIDRVLAKYLPVTMDILETKKDGEYNFVRKPFMRSGKYSASVEKHFEELEDEIAVNPGDILAVSGPFSRVLFRPIDLGSAAEVKDWMLSQGWEPAEWNLDDEGNQRSPKMPKDGEFPGVEGKAGRLYAKRAKAVHRRSNLEGWLARMRPDGRISARVTGIADTRRMKHAGVVNVPNSNAFFGHQMRRAFIARPGWVLVGTDAASCQDRMLAARAGSADFTKMMLEGDKDEGTDGHSLARDAINEVLAKYKLHPINRGTAKNFNYGWKFGASDNKLGRMAGGSKEVGEEIRAALGRVFPAQQALIDRLTAEWRGNAKRRTNRWGKLEYYDGWINGLDGAPIFIKLEHTLLVYTLQSDEAIFMSGAYNFLNKKLEAKYKRGVDFEIVGWIHDEFQVECRREIAEDVAKISEDSIAASSKFYKLEVPQEGEADIGINWSETH